MRPPASLRLSLIRASPGSGLASGAVIRTFVFFKRRTDLSLEEFRSRWQKAHPEVVLQLPGLLEYWQHPTHDSGYRKHEPDYDGASEVAFDSVDAMRSLNGSAELKAVEADEANFMDASSRNQVLTSGHVVIDGPRNGITMLACLNRLPGSEPAHFSTYWREQHSLIASKVPGLRCYVQHHVVPGIYAAGREPVYDGIAETQLDDLDAMRANIGNEQLAATRADEANFMTGGRLPLVISESLQML